MDIETRKLGSTDLDVTVLGFGAMELRGPKSPIPKGRPVDPVQAETTLNVALDHGINLIDTSIDYGESEGLIGRFISHRRNEFLLASKCGCNADTDGVEAGNAPRHLYTRENIINGVELSLKRLNTEYLDILQFHGSPPPESREEAVQALLDLKRDGKTRFIGNAHPCRKDQPDIQHRRQTGTAIDKSTPGGSSNQASGSERTFGF